MFTTLCAGWWGEWWLKNNSLKGSIVNYVKIIFINKGVGYADLDFNLSGFKLNPGGLK